MYSSIIINLLLWFAGTHDPGINTSAVANVDGPFSIIPATYLDILITNKQCRVSNKHEERWLMCNDSVFIHVCINLDSAWSAHALVLPCGTYNELKQDFLFPTHYPPYSFDIFLCNLETYSLNRKYEENSGFYLLLS